MIYNDQLVYKVVIWKFFGISLWKEKVALTTGQERLADLADLFSCVSQPIYFVNASNRLLYFFLKL